MSDYIKREDAERMVAGMKSADGLSAVKALGVIPSTDVAPVVRCKDCKWHQDNATWEDFINHCKWISTETPDDDDFCSCGERKDNDSD